MKLITVRQPHASAFFRLDQPKNIENRSFPTKVRGQIGIHAGQRPTFDALPSTILAIRDGRLPISAVLGTVQIVGCHNAGSGECEQAGCYDNWCTYFDRNEDRVPAYRRMDAARVFHWQVANPREFVTPIKTPGKLGFWDPSPSVNHLVEIADVHDRARA